MYKVRGEIGVHKAEVDYFYFWTPKFPDAGCLVPASAVTGKEFRIDFSDSVSHPLKNWYKDYLCAETLHRASHPDILEDEEKVQTTN